MTKIFYVLRRTFVILLLYIMFSISLFSNTDNFDNVKIYGHQFTPNETATFVAIVNQLQAELELVPANLANNNVSLAQNHANKAASLLTPRILVEIAEDNPRLAGDLRSALIQSISSSSESQVKSVSQLVSDLNERLGEDANVRMAQVQPTSSNFLEGVTNFLGNIFGGSDKEAKDQKTRLEALALANVIDGVLINYGNAYHVGFDMTNMSNMVMIGNNSSPGSMVMNNPVTGNNSGPSDMNMNMQSMNTSSNTLTMTQHGGEMNTGYSLVNMSDYQSAQALATKASEIFNTKLKYTTVSNNNSLTAFVTNLEKGLTQLNDSIAKKASPLEVMMIVHTQIHTNLLEAFNLQLLKQ